MQIFTPSFLKGLRSNLNYQIPTNTTAIEFYDGVDLTQYNKYYFQVLVFENVDEDPKLIYGTKEDLQTKYGFDVSDFPSYGVEVDRGFLSTSDSRLKAATFSTVRFLLQCRRLSQLMSYTWLNEVPENIKLSRKVFDSYNLIPETFWLERDTLETIDNDFKLNKKLSRLKNTEDDLLDYFLIKPKYISYTSISLALLLCGQAYYLDQDNNNKWTKICDPIFSTYEMVWEYALELSWDTFYASRIDLSSSTGMPQPPYTKVTLGYPPRPDEFSCGQDKIEKWATAQDDDEGLGFYPEEGSADWNNQQLKRVEPPYPYLPLSSS